jgi:small-conductance mechanosensitive channel
VIVLVTRYILKAIHLVFRAIGAGAVTFRGFHRDWAAPTYNIVRFLVIAFAVVVMWPYLPGSGSDAFKGVSLFVGVLFSLGSSGAVGNIVAGVVLTYTRAFQIGDRVKIGETTGDVLERTLLVTRVRTIKNVEVTIPNGAVLGNQVVNYSSQADTHGLILHTTVTIGYDAPWKQVHELLIAAARATPEILEDPAPFVLQTSLDDFYVSYQINAYTRNPSVMARTYSALHQNIQDQFNEGGVEIMSPHYGALRDGNQVTIPAQQLPKNYQTPAFRLTRIGDSGE